MKNEDHIYILTGKFLSGNASPEEEKELKDLINESEENKILFNDLKKFWEFENTEKTSSRKEDILKNIKSSIKKKYKLLYAAAAVLILAVLTTILFQYKTDNEIIVASKNKIKKIEMPDKTTIWLAQNSEISYSSEFNKSNRNVKLKGEAFFTVSHNESLPFIVETLGTETKVVGTKFSINTNKKKEVEIILKEGKVLFSVINKKEKTSLVKGEKAVYNTDTKKITKTSVSESENRKEWRKLLNFENKTLKEVVVILENVFDKKIEVDKSVENIELGSDFTHMSFEEIINTLKLHNIKIDSVNNVIIMKQ